MSEPLPFDPASITERTDARWFAEEVQPHEPRLRAWLSARFPQLGDLGDVVQETYARLFRAKRKGGVRSVRAFLFITARNAAYDVYRRERPDVIQLVEDISRLPVLEEGSEVPEAISQKEELELLAQAMLNLPDRCRQVFTLRKIFGVPQKEIAAQLGISEHTVEVQVAKGARTCAAYLRARGIFR